jgi:hypothetical protein
MDRIKITRTGSVVAFGEDSNEHLYCIKRGEFLDRLTIKLSRRVLSHGLGR